MLSSMLKFRAIPVTIVWVQSILVFLNNSLAEPQSQPFFYASIPYVREVTCASQTLLQEVVEMSTSDSSGAVDSDEAPPVRTIDAVNTKKQPPPESTESIWTRRLVILSFWAVVVFLGLPVWWKTTTVYRANLPVQEMLDWADGKVLPSANTACLALMNPSSRSVVQYSHYASLLMHRPCLCKMLNVL